MHQRGQVPLEIGLGAVVVDHVIAHPGLDCEGRAGLAVFEALARVARLNSEYCDRCPALANASEELKQYEAVVDAAEPPADTDNRL